MKPKTRPPSPPASEQDFPIVGIGASAGGLDAFRRFLKAIPEDSGMAYVLVQHLDPSHESILPELLSRATKIPVSEITDQIHLAPDNIYVISPNSTIKSEDGVLRLTSRDTIRPYLPIDIFFTSLAEVHQGLAVGVVLSGTASDGTLGLKAIKAYGGITFAQDSKSAAYAEMPRNAINADVVDFVLPPEKIPGKILQVRHIYEAGNPPGEEQSDKSDEHAFKQIVSLISQRSGVEFAHYKQTTMHRRIARRMAINDKENLQGYLKFLRLNKDEQDLLFNDILLQVTSFFRDSKIFASISKTVIPFLLKHSPVAGPIRIWVAGCSSGEEAYSLAILFQEYFSDEALPGRRIQIFASDISEAAIIKARTGSYHKLELKSVPALILKKYFTKANGGYQVNRSIRDMCVFAVHNLLKDPPFAKMDLISCRNVLIYLDTFLQKKALTTFHYALKENGVLLLGKSETISPAKDFFNTFDKDSKIYSRKSVHGHFMQPETGENNAAIPETDKKSARPEIQKIDFRKSAEAVLLSKYTPASVVIDEQMDIVHIHGTIAPFLEPPQGSPTFNLLKMAREGLAFELRNMLHKAKAVKGPVMREGLRVNDNGKAFLTSIEIIPLANADEPYYLVLFLQSPVPKRRGKAGSDASNNKIDEEAQQRILALEKELAQTREDMRSITEDQEAANEELQSANEEFQSSNEEMQSLNEELETSKEELQSTNEELIIVNQELLDKQVQINASRNYAEAVLATIREPLLVLDKTLSIKSVNNSFCSEFDVSENELLGEPIYQIKNGIFDNWVLRSLLEKVIPQKKELINYEIRFSIQNKGEYTLLLNARHVLNEKDAEALILFTIEDITERKKENERMKHFSSGLEAQVKERTASLEQSNLQLEQFAHTASHELQEPLRKIATFSKLLKNGQSKTKSIEELDYLNKIEESSSRLSLLVRHLLDFASINQLHKVYEKTDLNIIFKNILDDFELTISEKKAVITHDKFPEIEAVSFQMNQLFYDLLSNALKFSKPSVPPVIHVSSHKLSKEEIKSYPGFNNDIPYYELVFKDNGIGFDQKYSQQIFTMFQRLDVSGDYPGTGIGLALCKKIVQNYQGEIFAKSKKNEGASFHLILPLRQPKAEN